jgi:hypothetical protein
MYNDICTAIVSLLGGISDIKSVYNGQPNEVSDYPTAFVYPNTEADAYLDLRDIKRLSSVSIRIVGQLDNTNYIAIQSQIRQICTEVVEMLWSTANLTLGGKVSFPTEISTSFDGNSSANSFYRATIVYKATKRFTRG